MQISNLYQAFPGWLKLARLTLYDDGTVTFTGDYDFGYRTWRLFAERNGIVYI